MVAMVAQQRGVSSSDYIDETTVPEFLVEAAATWLRLQAPIALAAEAVFGTGDKKGKKRTVDGPGTTALLPDGTISKKRPPEWFLRQEEPEWIGRPRPKSLIDKRGADQIWHDIDTPAGESALVRTFSPGGVAQRLARAQSQNLKRARARRLS